MRGNIVTLRPLFMSHSRRFLRSISCTRHRFGRSACSFLRSDPVYGSVSIWHVEMALQSPPRITTVGAKINQIIKILHPWRRSKVPHSIANAFRAARLVPLRRDGRFNDGSMVQRRQVYGIGTAVHTQRIAFGPNAKKWLKISWANIMV
jgi:hypothetical protein